MTASFMSRAKKTRTFKSNLIKTHIDSSISIFVGLNMTTGKL